MQANVLSPRGGTQFNFNNLMLVSDQSDQENSETEVLRYNFVSTKAVPYTVIVSLSFAFCLFQFSFLYFSLSFRV